MKRVRYKIFNKCSKTVNQFSCEVDIQMGDETYNRIRDELMVDEGINHLRNQMFHQMKIHFKKNWSI